MNTIEQRKFISEKSELNEKKPNVNLEEYLKEHHDFDQLLRPETTNQIETRHVKQLKKSATTLTEIKGLNKDQQKEVVGKIGDTFKMIMSWPIVREAIYQGKNSVESIGQLGVNIKNTLHDSLSSFLQFGLITQESPVGKIEKKEINKIKEKLAQIKAKNEKIIQSKGFLAKNKTMQHVGKFFAEVKLATANFILGASVLVGTTVVLSPTPLTPVGAFAVGGAATAAVMGAKSEYERQRKENQDKVENLTAWKMENLIAKVKKEDKILNLIAYQNILSEIGKAKLADKKTTARIENILLTKIDDFIAQGKGKSAKYELKGNKLILALDRKDQDEVEKLSETYWDNFHKNINKEKNPVKIGKIIKEAGKTVKENSKTLIVTTVLAGAYYFLTGSAHAQVPSVDNTDWSSIYKTLAPELKKSLGYKTIKGTTGLNDGNFDSGKLAQFKAYYQYLTTIGKTSVINSHSSHIANIINNPDGSLTGLKTDDLVNLADKLKGMSDQEIRKYLEIHNIDPKYANNWNLVNVMKQAGAAIKDTNFIEMIKTGFSKAAHYQWPKEPLHLIKKDDWGNSLIIENLKEYFSSKSPAAISIGNLEKDILQAKKEILKAKINEGNNNSFSFLDNWKGNIGKTINDNPWKTGIILTIITLYILQRKKINDAYYGIRNKIFKPKKTSVKLPPII